TTLTGFLSYITINTDKLLLGRVWGTEATGLYSRAFYLINFPTENLNITIGEVAFAALFTFLALNGMEFEPPEVEATMTILSMAAGETDDDAFIAWVRRHAAPPA
ncbi:oligosaccharide flippase family protein, partial [Comamonas sp.]|uniref:oligosaccharide flippase family protein n=1 Tax=Comamonas sp. TaxID=34028 RepID=UPI001AC42491